MQESPDWNAPEPIVFDPEIQELLTAPGPSLEDIENMESRSVVDHASGDAETLDGLIAVLEEMRRRFGGDAKVKDFDTGTPIHLHGVEYDDGEAVVRL